MFVARVRFGPSTMGTVFSCALVWSLLRVTIHVTILFSGPIGGAINYDWFLVTKIMLIYRPKY